MKTQLTTVPSFTFRQGDMFDGAERPIEVRYYNGTITLSQEGEYEVDECIHIDPKKVRALFQAILKHQPEAEHFLNKP